MIAAGHKVVTEVRAHKARAASHQHPVLLHTGLGLHRRPIIARQLRALGMEQAVGAEQGLRAAEAAPALGSWRRFVAASQQRPHAAQLMRGRNMGNI